MKEFQQVTMAGSPTFSRCNQRHLLRACPGGRGLRLWWPHKLLLPALPGLTETENEAPQRVTATERNSNAGLAARAAYLRRYGETIAGLAWKGKRAVQMSLLLR